MTGILGNRTLHYYEPWYWLNVNKCILGLDEVQSIHRSISSLSGVACHWFLHRPSLSRCLGLLRCHTGCHGFWPVMTSNCWSSARIVDGVLLSRKRSMQRSVTTAIYRKCKFQHPRFTTPSRAASTSSGPRDYILSKCCNDGKSLAAYGTWTFPVLISVRPRTRPEKLWALLSQF